MNSYWSAIKVTTQQEADAALAEAITIAREQNPSLSYEQAREIQLSNIGYFIGYLSEAERLRALELYPEARHPLFGRWEHGALPPDVVIKAGIAAGAALREGEGLPEALQAGRALIEAYIQAPKE